MTGVHDWAKFVEGFGRATDHATRDIRSGITREQGLN